MASPLPIVPAIPFHSATVRSANEAVLTNICCIVRSSFIRLVKSWWRLARASSVNVAQDMVASAALKRSKSRGSSGSVGFLDLGLLRADSA